MKTKQGFKGANNGLILVENDPDEAGSLRLLEPCANKLPDERMEVILSAVSTNGTDLRL